MHGRTEPVPEPVPGPAQLLEKIEGATGKPTAADLKRDKARKQKARRKKRAMDKYAARSDSPGEEQAQGNENIEDVEG